MKLLFDVIDIIRNISWTADIAGVLVALGIGVIWYHPSIFGSQISKRKELIWIFPLLLFISANITAFCKHFEYTIPSKGFLIGYDLGLIVCLFLGILFIAEKRPLKQYLIHAVYILITMSLMGMTIGEIL